MKEYQMVKHICKFCYKSFPCGKSLGGHMRSHMINTPESADKPSRKKLPTLVVNGVQETAFIKDYGAQNTFYTLRESRKKSSRLNDNYSHDTKLCKECGKEFPSWRALCGHMKCHSDEFSYSTEDDDLYGADEEKPVMDSQSDNEAAAPIRKQRSSRIFKRYRTVTTTTSNSTNTISNVDDPSRVYETEQEEEEVALTLIMLSKDVGGWKSIGDASVNNPELDQESLSETVSESKILKRSDHGMESEVPQPLQKSSKLELNSIDDAKILKSKDIESEHSATAVSTNMEVENKNSEVCKDAFVTDSLMKTIEVEDKSESNLEVLEVGSVKNDEGKLEKQKQRSIKRKQKALVVQEMNADCSMKLVSDNVSDSPVTDQQGSDKKIKFECNECNKCFHSYQALGGHRASHKKMKSWLDSKNGSIEKSSENTKISPDQSGDNNAATAKSSLMCQKLGSSDATINMRAPNANNLIPRPGVFDPKFKSRKLFISDSGLKKLTNSDYGVSKKHNRVHECPICFKIFPSGQAFGGHKRSHLLAEAKNNIKQTDHQTASVTTDDQIDHQQQIPEIRDFLDLNLPAPEQEDQVINYNSNDPWWMASNQKGQPLHVGLI